MKRLFVLAAAGLALVAAQPAAAADAAKEITTAAAHAGMAAGSPDMKMVQSHLQHVVNCLVGPGGAGFDANQANPCKGQGMGAIPDSPADKRMALEAALKMARDGMAESDLDKAKAKASATQAALGKLAM
ncbi:hypothetical protein [Magnetospirillum sp. SS-4]|uniref:hypothetical protein n=1 Tax=Magnetospirillum sp. SS-4 TaxID=2681465 RepID=UPI001380F5ED|nr:hypothetical protein [Magnetospirillum sp. SS-4]CAA7617577.1 conserved exported hypothetical protein [Magnetospirillum sp. SS-4]